MYCGFCLLCARTYKAQCLEELQPHTLRNVHTIYYVIDYSVLVRPLYLVTITVHAGLTQLLIKHDKNQLISTTTNSQPETILWKTLFKISP